MAKKEIEKVAEDMATTILGRTRQMMEAPLVPEVDEARTDSEHASYATVDATGKPTDNPDKITKVIATLKSYDSQRYTKLGRNLLRIQQLEDEIKALKDEIKGEDKVLIADLFDAEDRVLTREIDTVGFLFKLTKDPKATESFKYKEVLEALQEHFTPELVQMMERLKEKFKTVTQKSPGLSTIDKAAVPQESVEVTEGFMDKLKEYLAKFKGLVAKWADNYAKRLADLKVQSGLSFESVSEEEISEAVTALKNRITVLESQLAEYGQSFSYNKTPGTKSVVADVKPEEVKIVLALWCYEGTSDKIWAIAECRGKFISTWGKRMGNQMTGERNWQYQFKPYAQLAAKIDEKRRKGYDPIIREDRVLSNWGGGAGILNFVKSVAARVFNTEELKAAMRSNDDHMVARGGAMESAIEERGNMDSYKLPGDMKNMRGKEDLRNDAVLALQGDPRSKMRKDVAKKWLKAHGYSDEFIAAHAAKDRRSEFWTGSNTWDRYNPPTHYNEDIAAADAFEEGTSRQKEQTTEDKMVAIKVAVLAHNANGEPQFFVYNLNVSQPDIDEGFHYDSAKEAAEHAGFSGPMIAFAEGDPAWKQLLVGAITENKVNVAEAKNKATAQSGKETIAAYNAARQSEEEAKLKGKTADERNPRFAKKKDEEASDSKKKSK